MLQTKRGIVREQRTHRFDQKVEIRRLRIEQVLPMEEPAQMPVGRVEKAHVRTVTAHTDRNMAPRGEQVRLRRTAN